MHLLAVSHGLLNLHQLCLYLSLCLCPSLRLHSLTAKTTISLITPTLCSAAFSGSFKVAGFKEKAPGSKNDHMKNTKKEKERHSKIALIREHHRLECC